MAPARSMHSEEFASEISSGEQGPAEEDDQLVNPVDTMPLDASVALEDDRQVGPAGAMPPDASTTSEDGRQVGPAGTMKSDASAFASADSMPADTSMESDRDV